MDSPILCQDSMKTWFYRQEGAGRHKASGRLAALFFVSDR